MEQPETFTTTARIGQRGRLILPAQVQRALRVTQGATVALRTEPDGSLVIEPLWVVRNRLREKYAELLADHLPAGPAQLHGGGRDSTEASEPAELGPALQPLPERGPGTGRWAYRDDARLVLTARAVLAWVAVGPGLVENALPYGVLPEAAVEDLVTVLVRAGVHEHADALLADLAVLGVRVPGPAKQRATLAQDTAVALKLIEEAARAGYVLTLPDARCAAAAVRLEARLIAADLLTPLSGVG
ncbi:AbrB/MazE/SpoVT family DNA-binding domain-containing protein [Streptomyces tsukubensis]|uniref:AbrB/MazE/SpoVT family DNA-binding domain-containing protein n=1 Tax=Streptomyces tsukubensis TaxID=83656 RepID=UPI00344DC128